MAAVSSTTILIKITCYYQTVCVYFTIDSGYYHKASLIKSLRGNYLNKSSHISCLHISWSYFDVSTQWVYAFRDHWDLCYIFPQNLPLLHWLVLLSLHNLYYSVQFSRSAMSDSLRPHELQHARPPCLSPTQWTWDEFGWWTGRPGVLQFMGSQRVGHGWATELNLTMENSRPVPQE